MRISNPLSVLGLTLALVAASIPAIETADARSFRSSGSSSTSSSRSSSYRSSTPARKPAASTYTSPNKAATKSNLYGTPYKAAPARPAQVNKTVVNKTTVINQGGGMGGGVGGGSGIGGALIGGAVGGIGGAMLYDAMTDDEGASKEQVQAQVDEALAKERAAQQAADLQKQIEALQLQQQQLLGNPVPAVQSAPAPLIPAQ